MTKTLGFYHICSTHSRQFHKPTLQYACITRPSPLMLTTHVLKSKGLSQVIVLGLGKGR